MGKQLKVQSLEFKVMNDSFLNFKLPTFSLLIYLFFLFPILTYSQVVDELIPLDTTSETIQVIYQPTQTESYYQKKIAVFAADTSQIAIEKTFARGVQNGIYKAYYSSGKLKVKTVYANGKINGEWTWFNPEGIILVKGIYMDGVKHGFWAYKSIKTYGRFKKGLMHRTWYKLDANERKIKSYYENGVLKKGDGIENEALVPDTNYVVNDTLIVEATQPIETLSTIKKEYQQAIDFLATNFIFRKTIKTHFQKDIQQFKKNYKRDVFQFVIETKVPTMEINTFIQLSNEGKIEVATIDSILKADSETLKQNFNQTNIQLDEGLVKYSTNNEAPIHIYFSEVKYGLLRIDVVWQTEKAVEKNTYKILLYFDEAGILKAAEYQK